MARVKVPAHVGFPHDLGIQERAALVCYGQLVAQDPAAASYESVAVALNKEYSTVKNQLDSARRKMRTNTTWGAYLLMMARERVQTRQEQARWEANNREPSFTHLMALSQALGVACTAFAEAPSSNGERKAEAPAPDVTTRKRGRPRKGKA